MKVVFFTQIVLSIEPRPERIVPRLIIEDHVLTQQSQESMLAAPNDANPRCLVCTICMHFDDCYIQS